MPGGKASDGAFVRLQIGECEHVVEKGVSASGAGAGVRVVAVVVKFISVLFNCGENVKIENKLWAEELVDKSCNSRRVLVLSGGKVSWLLGFGLRSPNKSVRLSLKSL